MTRKDTRLIYSACNEYLEDIKFAMDADRDLPAARQVETLTAMRDNILEQLYILIGTNCSRAAKDVCRRTADEISFIANNRISALRHQAAKEESNGLD